jgi:hypothetical protein
LVSLAIREIGDVPTHPARGGVDHGEVDGVAVGVTTNDEVVILMPA